MVDTYNFSGASGTFRSGAGRFPGRAPEKGLSVRMKSSRGLSIGVANQALFHYIQEKVGDDKHWAEVGLLIPCTESFVNQTEKGGCL